MNNWEKFKNQNQSTGESKPQGRKVGGNYTCQFCNRPSVDAMYFPVDSVLRYECENGHENFLEGFKLAF